MRSQFRSAFCCAALWEKLYFPSRKRGACMWTFSSYTLLNIPAHGKKSFSMETNNVMDKTFRCHCTYWLFPLQIWTIVWHSLCICFSFQQAYVKCIRITSPSRRSQKDGGSARRFSTSLPASSVLIPLKSTNDASKPELSLLTTKKCQ